MERNGTCQLGSSPGEAGGEIGNECIYKKTIEESRVGGNHAGLKLHKSIS